MLIKCHAKINVVLNVLGKYNEKLHEIDSIMLPLKLHDSILMTKLKGNRDSYVTFADYSLGGFENNLATLAMDKFKEIAKSEDEFRILINKAIPISAGLGGGSSNCAGTLLGLKQMTNSDISMDKLKKIGFSLGSDVPFFFYNVPARVRGAGEIVDPIYVKNDYYVLIVKPKQGLSTSQVYQESDKYTLKTYDINKVLTALSNGDDELLANSIGNSLEDVSMTLLDDIKTIKEEMKQLGLKIVMMSGSGSSVFAMSANKKEIKKAYYYFIKKYPDNEIEFTSVLKK